MPLMRIRSVEIVFEDEMSTCTDTAILDRSFELVLSDSSDDSTKCVDDLEHLHVDKDDSDDSVTLNPDADLSDDNFVSMTNKLADDRIATEETPQPNDQHFEESRDQVDCLTLPNDENTLSQNISEIVDSGRYTEDACSSHVEVPILTYDDALLSHSFDVVNVDESSTVMSLYEHSEVTTNNRDHISDQAKVSNNMCELSEVRANMCVQSEVDGITCEEYGVSPKMRDLVHEQSEINPVMHDLVHEQSQVSTNVGDLLHEQSEISTNKRDLMHGQSEIRPNRRDLMDEQSEVSAVIRNIVHEQSVANSNMCDLEHEQSEVRADMCQQSDVSANNCDRVYDEYESRVDMIEHYEDSANTPDRMCELSEDSINMYERMSELCEVSVNMYERMCELSDISTDGRRKLFEYVESDSVSDSSDNTAVCDGQNDPTVTSSHNEDPEDQSLCESSDLQYDSFVDMGKF